MLITSTIAQSKKQAFNNANVNSLLSVNADAKTVKGNSEGYLTGILYLAPHNTVTSHKVKTVCPSAVAAGCQNACLYTAGRGKFSSVQAGRIKRTESFLADSQAFLLALWYDVQGLIRKAAREGVRPAIRLNGTSDIPWHKYYFTNPEGITDNIFNMFPDVQFYDYTKNTHYLNGELPNNYYIVFSYSEFNNKYASKAYNAAINNNTGLAVVFRNKQLPETFLGLPVINADKTDLRFTDKEAFNITGPYIVGLYAKGKARYDNSGFVINNGSK